MITQFLKLPEKIDELSYKFTFIETEKAVKLHLEYFSCK